MRTAVLTVVFVLVSAQLCASDTDRSPDWEERMLDAINAERSERGLPAYRADRRLERAAAEHSRRMVEADTLSHRLSGEAGLNARVAATGLRFDSVAENVGYSTRPEDLHDNLMRSHSHRENLLSTRFDAIGIAIYRSADRWYVTQDFAHTTSEASPSEAEDDLARAVAALRRDRRLPEVEMGGNDELRAAACAMARRDEVDTSLLPSLRGHRRAVAFTTFEPGELNDVVQKIATDPDLRRLEIGACHGESRSYPAGVFWFALSY